MTKTRFVLLADLWLMRKHRACGLITLVALFCTICESAAGDQAELVSNGTFESGSAYWNVVRLGACDSAWIGSGPCAYSGSYRAVLGDFSGCYAASGSIHQQIFIPSNATTMMLRYYVNITSDEGTTTAYDKLDVAFRTFPGDSLITTADSRSNKNKAGAWGTCPSSYTQRVIDVSSDLAPYRGQTITLQFYVITDDSDYPTLFRIDNVSLIATTATAVTWYRDTDGDGYGDPNQTTQSVAQPAGYVSDHSDCDDTRSSVHPGATEVCSNNRDDNCNGQIDENCGTMATWYRDADGDGYGDLNQTTQSVAQPAGYVSNHSDCDDTRSSVHPGATEVCSNSRDDNCNGQIDENCGTVVTWYRDADGDGYGDPNQTTQSVTQPAGYVTDHSDCDDTRSSVHPGATEVCSNGRDDNCNGQIDENCGTVVTWYRDADGDGYGDPNQTTQSVTQPVGYVSEHTDCDDADPAVHPGATDTPDDGIDQDCNGSDAAGPGTAKAQITAPANGSRFTSSTVTFIWNTGTGASGYWLTVGTTQGGYELYGANQGTGLSATVSGLPTNGSTLYVQLYSFINGVWQLNDYTYTASNGMIGPTITNIDPSPVHGSDSPQWITVNGSGFRVGLKVHLAWTGDSKTLADSQVSLISLSQLRIYITTLNVSDNWTVEVINVDGVRSGPKAFRVEAVVTGCDNNVSPEGPPGTQWLCSPFYRSRNGIPITAIVIHTMQIVANGVSDQQMYDNTISEFQHNEERGVSAHYLIGPDGQITQMVKLSDSAQHAYYYNPRSIGIEVAGAAEDAAMWTPTKLDALATLVAWLVQRYPAIPVEHPAGDATSADGCRYDKAGIVGHYQIQTKGCFPATVDGRDYLAKPDPGTYFRWDAFISDVRAKLNPAGAHTLSTSPVPDQAPDIETQQQDSGSDTGQGTNALAAPECGAGLGAPLMFGVIGLMAIQVRRRTRRF